MTAMMVSGPQRGRGRTGARGAVVLLGLAVTACGPGTVTGDPAEPQEIRVPDGYAIEVFAELRGVRTLRFGPDGALYAVQSGPGRVVRYAAGGGGQPEVLLEALRQPYGLAFHDGWTYVAETHRVVRYRGAGLAESEVVVPDLPTGGHWTREIVFGPDGRLYLAVGSSCNVCEEADPRRAAVVRYRPDGTGEEIVAVGLRNVAGLAVHPGTGDIWASQNERDHLGDDLPPEEINVLSDGRDFGWPVCYGRRIANPEYADRASECGVTVPPALEMQAHSAPLGMTFYTGDAFPADVRGDLFVAFHGSWNRTVPTGYKLVRVEVEGGRPVRVHDFATGWLVRQSEVKGRPVYPAVGPDGALYLSDDGAGRIWRIRWTGGAP